ncbi:DUF488 domain-containing protein [Stappia indica]|uniref:Uncharacterized conserved protein YeaO, DUF488 family n=1 Tax=Stappia indica TaxID=538381 RepID=A0A285TE03_9HYPH|nr:DUF488 family protein [Stappia indica]SOC20349.1 Uncharacterized conserved protein YeaO, DUF488 family [Stappia indica]
MSVRIVRLGTDRGAGEGPRLGTVRRPPRGVRKEDYAAGNWYDTWLPELSPSAELVGSARAALSEAEWAAFVKAFRKEMAAPGPSHLLDTLAVLSHSGAFSLGCYCEDEARCHRSVLRELLAERGADIA